MDALFKKFGWIFTLMFLSLASYLLAGTVNNFVGQRFWTVPQPGQVAPETDSAKAAKPKKDISSIINRNVFNTPISGDSEDGAGANEPDIIEPDLTQIDMSRTNLRAELVATIVSSNPYQSIAVINDQAARETEVYSIGDMLMNEATIIGIQRLQVILERSDGRKEYLNLEKEGKGGSAARTYQAKPKVQQVANTGGKGVKQVGENEYIIAKSEIENTLGDLSKVATQARIVPSFKNGKPVGFKLFSIRPKSIYAKIGIQNGDVINKINGYELNSPDKALEVYQRLKDSKTISIELERRGTKRNFKYQVR